MKNQKIMLRFMAIYKRIKDDIYLWRWALIVLLIYGCATQVIFGNTCPFVILSGFPCPACGLTRGVFAIVLGKWNMALRYNVTAFLWLPLLLWICWRRYIIGYNKGYWKQIVIVVAIITVIYYIYRMHNIFPGHSPMCYNEHNILALILNMCYK